MRSLKTRPGKASGSILAFLAFPALLILATSVPTSNAATVSEQQGLIPGWDQLPPAELESRLPDANPVNYYMYTGRLWKDGDKDKAVFWLYVAQLRFRFLLATEPHPDPSGGPALFESLQATIGQPILLYAASEPSKWVEQINSALQWDESNPNGFTSKSKYKKQWEETRAGLVKLRDYVLAHADEIKKQAAQQRTAEGGMKDGVFVYGRRPQMPADWPPLEPATPVDRVVGIYRANLQLGHSLFLGEGRKTLKAATFEISKAEPDGILLVAKNGDEELARRTVGVREQDGAIVFDEDAKPDAMTSGGIHEVVYLRVNTNGDLVVQSDWHTEGTFQKSSVPVRTDNTFWFRATRVSN